MDEFEWYNRGNPFPMLEFLVGEGKTSERKLRLFACACSRRISRLMDSVADRTGVEITEFDVDQRVPAEVFVKALGGVFRIDWGRRDGTYSASAALIAYWTEANCGRGEWPGELPEVLHDLIGNPFHRTEIVPTWLGSAVLELARGIYTDRAFDRLPILADALEEAGCTDEVIFSHCRGPGPHVRGCWVVDLLLGKE